MQLSSLLQKGFHSANHLLRRADSIFERRSEFNTPPLFIIGPPRSGTTLTYQIVTRYFQVGYMTAPLAYSHGLSSMVTRLLRPWIGRPTATFESGYGNIPGLLVPSEHVYYWSKWFPEDENLGHYVPPETVSDKEYADLRRSLHSLASILCRPWVFKCPYISISAGALARMIPEARFLVMRRDLLLVCQSAMQGRERFADARNWWSVKPPHYREWLELPVWQQVARQTFYADAIPRRDLQQYAPDRFVEIDYSELCRQPHACMKELGTWLQPSGYETYPDSSIPETFTASDRVSIEPEQADLIRHEFETLRQQFNAESA